jgi:alpha-L-fucosidase
MTVLERSVQRYPQFSFPARRAVLWCCTAILLCFFPRAASAEGKRYEPTYNSLKEHPLPAWFEDAKLGIFVHWGIYSVPAWAPPSEQFGKLPEREFFKRNPYAEWYFNSMRIEGSATQEHHRRHYGEAFDYYRFGEEFNRQVANWDPASMAELFRRVHARYVVLTTKHHDGFTLWPSGVKNPHRPDAHAARDIVGELSAAVKARGMRMGLYYSGGIDWSFHPILIDGPKEGRLVTPAGNYAAYADAHWRELIERYRPSILWNDIRYPEASGLMKIVADFYNDNPDGVINDRWGRWMTHDFTTAEYSSRPKDSSKKWEATRGIGNSFGYNQAEAPQHMLTVDELVDTLIDIVSHGGNLLLNVGPRADGSISELQLERLRGLGAWLDVNERAIFGTRRWVDADGQLANDTVQLRFTYRPPGVDAAPENDAVYIILLSKPASRTILVTDLVPASDSTQVRILGHSEPLSFSRAGDDLQILLPAELGDSAAYAIEVSPQPKRLMRR